MIVQLQGMKPAGAQVLATSMVVPIDAGNPAREAGCVVTLVLAGERGETVVVALAPGELAQLIARLTAAEKAHRREVAAAKK